MIARTTGFGLTRIIGELRKMGIKKISRQTVRNILKEEGMEPVPDRTSDSWENFLERHKNTLWGCDFFPVKTVTARGIRDVYVLVFLCLESREAIVSTSTEHPDSAWVVKQTEAFLEQTKDRTEKPDIVMHDKDTKFTKEFVAKLKEHGVRTNALPKTSPNLNARWSVSSRQSNWSAWQSSSSSADSIWTICWLSSRTTTTRFDRTWNGSIYRQWVLFLKKC
jgi:putative transposase